MKCFWRSLVCLVPMLAIVGCSASVEEKAPPTKAPEMTPEDKEHMESQMKMMREMQGKPAAPPASTPAKAE